MMGALYVKDEQAKFMADELAERRGLTKAAAVKLALANELAKDAPTRSVQEVLEDFWRSNKLGEPTGLEADKAFYDSLNDEEDD